MLKIKASIAGVFGLLTAAFGWFGWLVLLWVGCMALDWLSGTWAGAKRGEWNSKRARDGISHKGGMILVVLSAAALDWLISCSLKYLIVITLPFEYSVLICPLVICWYIVTELGSILENAVSLGAPCPAFLTNVLKIMNAKILKAGDTMAASAKQDEEEGFKAP